LIYPFIYFTIFTYKSHILKISIPLY
jgi:hypothetical protein